jgi:hypothetical protein
MTISLSGFIDFVRTDMGIDATQVPDNSPSISLAYGGAVEWVNQDIEMVMPQFYAVAVYNLAASFLVNYGTESVFAETRDKLKLNDFTAGLSPGPVTTRPARKGWCRISSKTCLWLTCRC